MLSPPPSHTHVGAQQNRQQKLERQQNTYTVSRTRAAILSAFTRVRKLHNDVARRQGKCEKLGDDF